MGIISSITQTILVLLFRLVTSFLNLVASVVGKVFGGGEVKRSKALALYQKMKETPLDGFQTRPRKVTVAHQQISGHRFGWFQEELYHVPLETGCTLMSRKIACRHRGKTFGTLLLVHGFSQNRHHWDLEERSLVNYLAEAGYDVFFLDLRGNRESLKVGSPYANSMNEYIEIDVHQALKVIKVVSSHKKVYLVGHSMGGAVCCAAAGLYPDIVGGVINIAGVYGFTANKNPTFQNFLKFDKFLRTHFPWLPKNLTLPTREIAHLQRVLRFIVNSPLSYIFVPIKILNAGSVEMNLMTRYLYETFEPASLGVLQGLTDIAHGIPLRDEQGNDYFKRFEALQCPLLVICSDTDDLVNLEDSLRCFENSQSKDKSKIVYMSEESADTNTYGHCDIVVGKHAVTHVWEKIRIWLDQRRKLGMDLAGLDSKNEYVITEAQFEDLRVPSFDHFTPSQTFLDKVLDEAYQDD